MITQRLVLEGGYPDGVWACASCGAQMEDRFITHPDNCPEFSAVLTTLSTEEVASRAGVPYSRIDQWCRSGYLRPEGGNGSGDPRAWPPGEADVACRMARFAGAGLPLGMAERVARQSGSEFELAPGVTLVVDDG